MAELGPSSCLLEETAPGHKLPATLGAVDNKLITNSRRGRKEAPPAGRYYGLWRAQSPLFHTRCSCRWSRNQGESEGPVFGLQLFHFSCDLGQVS